MGANYSFNLWLPTETLADALDVVASYDLSGAFLPLIWPDGRRLSGAESYAGEPVPIEFASDVACDLGQAFIPLQAEASGVREWNVDQRQAMLERRLDGDESYIVGDVSIGIRQWLDDDADLQIISLTAPGSSSSTKYLGDDARQLFVSIARAANAYCCDISMEGPSRLLWLRGEEFDQTFDEDHPACNATPFQLARYVGLPQSPAAQRLAPFDDVTELSAHQRAALFELARDADSGVRAIAIAYLGRTPDESVVELLQESLSDADWRVRIKAIEWLGDSEDGAQDAAQIARSIEPMLHDARPEVRIAAIIKLSWLDEAREQRRQILLQTPPTPANLGVIRAALDSFARPFANFAPLSDQQLERNRDVLTLAASLPNFPFAETVERWSEDGLYWP